jgi:hypothetical protein
MRCRQWAAGPDRLRALRVSSAASASGTHISQFWFLKATQCQGVQTGQSPGSARALLEFRQLYLGDKAETQQNLDALRGRVSLQVTERNLDLILHEGPNACSL